ncbi:MAG: hypothetical protein KJ670_11915 [Alphaproteobacteria bacterium]|nr:hypothetical protein [Alphaproteobacteria bacterium]MBU4050041.1 hypothetical protein [Alphaproteobacteria bacterium]MBU4089413.1 hypothetical protein [Alphaproteobacteria bacterium]MBU4155348.1 hypothetical protein [Alphaproteobacteria bacterium]
MTFSSTTRSSSATSIQVNRASISETKPSAYAGDGNRFLKIAFDDLGEIDFVACSQLTTKRIELHGRPILIETIADIITKKLSCRGSMITPRDVFDIAAAGKTRRRELVQALAGYPQKVSAAITALERANPEYVLSVIGDLQINPDFESLKETAIDECLAILRLALPSSQQKVPCTYWRTCDEVHTAALGSTVSLSPWIS